MIEIIWYSPEADVVVIQRVFENRISIEWSNNDLCKVFLKHGSKEDPFCHYLWYLIGKL